MNRLWNNLWQDEHGFVVSAEIVCISTLTVVGVIGGLGCLRDAVVCEMKEVSTAIRSVDQSYFYTGHHGCYSSCGLSSWTAGSQHGCVPCQTIVGGYEDREYLMRPQIQAQPTERVIEGVCPPTTDPLPPSSNQPCPQVQKSETLPQQRSEPTPMPAPATQPQPMAPLPNMPEAAPPSKTSHRSVIVEPSA